MGTVHFHPKGILLNLRTDLFTGMFERPSIHFHRLFRFHLFDRRIIGMKVHSKSFGSSSSTSIDHSLRPTTLHFGSDPWPSILYLTEITMVSKFKIILNVNWWYKLSFSEKNNRKPWIFRIKENWDSKWYYLCSRIILLLPRWSNFHAGLSSAPRIWVANVRTEFPPGGQKILKKNRSRLKYIQLEIAIIKNEILNLKIFELGKFWIFLER